MGPWPRLLWRVFMMWRDYALVGVVGNVTSVGDCGAIVAIVSGGAVISRKALLVLLLLGTAALL